MTKRDSNLLSLEGEKTLAHCFTYLLVLCIGSGILISLFRSNFETWLQWNIIGHSLIALAFCLPALLYQYVHFRRTVGIRKPNVLFTGLISSVLLAGVLGTGLYIAFFGQNEQLAWIAVTHQVLSYVALTIVVIHLIGHFFSKKKGARGTEKRFITLERKVLFKGTLNTLLAYSISVSLISVCYGLLYTPPVNELPANYDNNYGSHPFRPSLTETEDSGLIHVNQIAKSQQCGTCHEDIYQQWLSSTHRQAASDPAYVKNITLLVEKKGIAAARYCEGCHAPVALLTGELTEGGRHGGIKETPAHLDGVGCMGCHGIDKVLSTSGVASYLFSPKEHYLFDSAESKLAQSIRNFLIQSSPQKHKSTMGGHPMSDPKLCATCHEQFMDKDMNDWGWVKMQGTYQEWLQSPFSGQENQISSETQVTRCQDCHFSLIAANDPSASKNGMVASHRSLGANTFLPILNNDKEQLELTKRFLQSSKVLLHIEKPTPKNLVANKQTLENNLRSTAEAELPYFLYLGDTGEISVTVTNRLVGHSFPAGTTDLNQAWLSFSVKDASGEHIYTSGELDENNMLDKSTHIYHSTPVDRHGKAVWKHDLFRMTGESVKNVIEAGKSDIKSYKFRVPSWARSPITVEAVLNYRKLNQRYAEWALDSHGISIPATEIARDQLSIPILDKPKAISSESSAKNQ